MAGENGEDHVTVMEDLDHTALSKVSNLERDVIFRDVNLIFIEVYLSGMVQNILNYIKLLNMA